jgi:hypothetical protein
MEGPLSQALVEVASRRSAEIGKQQGCIAIFLQR